MDASEYTLSDAVCSAQDNLPRDYTIALTLGQHGWDVMVHYPNLMRCVWVHGENDDPPMGMTEAIVRAIDFAREREGLPG